MNLSNIWQHPKTSITGVLIAVGIVVGVLSQQGITLGHAGTGTVVALIGAMATGFLGLLAKDPGSSSGSGSTGGAGTAAMIALLCVTMVFAPVIGCTQQQKVNVAQEIVNWTPALTSAIDTAGGLVEVLDPPSALVIAPSLAIINALAPQITTAAKNYLANPSQTTIQVLQALIVQLQNNVNTALLNAVKITNPNSQQKATTAINGIATIVNSLLALVEGVSSKAQVAAMSRNVTVHLAEVRPLLDQRQMALNADRISRDLGLTRPVTVDQYFAYEAQAGF
jgi:hypothetical protein